MGKPIMSSVCTGVCTRLWKYESETSRSYDSYIYRIDGCAERVIINKKIYTSKDMENNKEE